MHACASKQEMLKLATLRQTKFYRLDAVQPDGLEVTMDILLLQFVSMLKLEISLAAEVKPLILEPHALPARKIVILIILVEFFASLQFNSLLLIGIQYNIHLAQLCLTKNCQPVLCVLIFCYSVIRRSDYKMVTAMCTKF